MGEPDGAYNDSIWARSRRLPFDFMFTLRCLVKRRNDHYFAAMQESKPTILKMQSGCDTGQDRTFRLVQQYLHLTQTVMPQLARSLIKEWPVQYDHCFQRIVLDNICGGVWYDHVLRPAYQHLSLQQAEIAVLLCENIIDGSVDIVDLNRKSLSWRGKR